MIKSLKKFNKLEEFIANNKLFLTGYFTQDLVDEELNKFNQLLIKNYVNNEKLLRKFKSGLRHWSRSIEFPYIYFNIAKFIIENKKNYQDKKFQIFDNACAHPVVSYLLAKYGMNVIGTDINRTHGGIDLSEEWGESDTFVNGSLTFKVADSLNLPFPNEKFDISFCVSAIEQIDDPIKAIEEMIRVTKSGGLLVFTMDIAHNKCNRSDFYVNKENFNIIQNRLNESCSFFAPAEFSVPCETINWEQNCAKRNFIKKFISDKYRNLINIKNPNFSIFGGSYIKK